MTGWEIFRYAYFGTFGVLAGVAAVFAALVIVGAIFGILVAIGKEFKRKGE